MSYINWSEILPITQAIGWTIFHSLWQIAIVALIVRVLHLIIPQNRTNLIYSVFLTGLLVSLGWTLNTFFSQWDFFQQQTHLTETSNMVINHVSTAANPLNSTAVNNLTNNDISTEIIYSTFNDSLLNNIEKLGDYIDPIIPYIALSWYLGALIFSISLIIGFFNLNKLNTTGIHQPSDDWLRRFETLKQRMGIRYNVRFAFSELIKEPITFYFFNPIVLAPIGIFSGLSAKQIEVLLLHELAHIRRYDYVVNIFQSIIEILFFYHPLVWWMSNRVRIEREHCCDDLVIKINSNPMLYAEALTQIQLHNFSSKTNLAMSANGKNTSSFSKRIFRLFGHYDQKSSKFKGSLILVCLLTTLILQAFQISAETQPEDSNNEVIELSDNLQINSTVTNSTKTISVEKNLEEITNNDIEKSVVISEVEEKQNQQISKLIPPKLSTAIPTLSLKPIKYLQKDKTQNLPLISVPSTITKDTSIVILLEDNEVNKKHEFYENFIQNGGPQFIQTLYEANIKMRNKLAKENSSPAKIITNEEYKNSLIFTIKQEGKVTYDTLQNYVILTNDTKNAWGGDKDKWEEKEMDFSVGAEGTMPDALVTTFIEDKYKSSSEIGVVLKRSADVKIEVLDENKKSLKVLANKSLSQGDHKFKWNKKPFKKGIYYIAFTVDNETINQRTRVE